ncbi:MAG: glutamate-1-semialdehyde 2,1-aminomutase [Rhodospirillaceae bacterium]
MTDTNAALYERARRFIPGGVNSPVRAFKSVGGTPRFIAKAEGAYVTDEDGKRYLDFVGSWGPLILGHAQHEVVSAVQKAAALGTTYGAPCRGEVDLAEKVVAAYPGLEQVRFVSSGTEATMSAIRLARGATGRDLVVKFSGCYHGHADHLLVAAGSGLVTAGQPSSAGVPKDFAALTRVLPLDDDARLDALFAAEGKKIAAVIVEPVPANNGLLLQRPAFLQKIRALTKEHGALLIFDEVISGFRVPKGSAAAHYGITPDLVTFGKVIGGGLPVGAYGGSRQLMSNIAPEGPVYQAGTLSGNPVAMAAGLATLRILERDNVIAKLDDMGAILEAKVTQALKAAGREVGFARLGSIFWLSFQPGDPPRSAEAVDGGAGARFAPLFQALLDKGIYIAPSAYEVGFLSAAHTQADIETLVAGLAETVAALPR